MRKTLRDYVGGQRMTMMMGRDCGGFSPCLHMLRLTGKIYRNPERESSVSWRQVGK